MLLFFCDEESLPLGGRAQNDGGALAQTVLDLYGLHVLLKYRSDIQKAETALATSS